MDRQTVSISNVHGGVALEVDEAAVIADMLDQMFHQQAVAQRLDEAVYLRARERLWQIIRVLRGEAPDAGED